MKKLLRKELSGIVGSGIIDTCHMGGDSAYCWTDCECTFGKVCQLDDDGTPGRCVGGGGNPGGGGCSPAVNCEEQPY
ncbi:MAG: hypothetical protein MUW56_10665 [Chryseobacterium sp.]|uniref:hypothetical protein n=1 Tax=Chryseobacterium sp. TaxID=1871047 RepID=UPI0025BBBB90|nr:hypothetical protein [Chryseobacterium sp.]MCJ7934074.1 hypothetical protein [Chryseobacterium sp.]